MRKHLLFLRVISLALFVLAVNILEGYAQIQTTLPLVNGGFEMNKEQGKVKPEGWAANGSIQYEEPGAFGRHAITLIGGKLHSDSNIKQNLDIPANVTHVTLSAAVKSMGIAPLNDYQEGVGYLSLQFFDAQSQKLKAPKKIKKWAGTFAWTLWSHIVEVPAGTRRVELTLGLDGAVGKISFDDLQILPGFPEDYDRNNFLIDGSFQYPGSFSDWKHEKGHRIVYAGHGERGALEIFHSKISSSESAQNWVLEGDNRGLTGKVSLHIKMTDVVSKTSEGGAWVLVDFFDLKEKFLSSQIIFQSMSGSTDWALKENEFKIPQGTSQGVFRILMKQAQGTASFDNVRFEIQGSGKHMLERANEVRTDTKGWLVYQAAEGDLTGALDASHLLDSPAGKHGFLKVQSGRFVFDDGTPVRFLGVNIQGNHAFPSHEDAERIAARLAQHGFNMARFHHMDSPWKLPNIFDPEADGTYVLSKDSLDKLDYFVAQLKQRGIYVYFDLLVSRRFKAGDRVLSHQALEDGAKVVSQFSERIIQLQQQYAEDLLTHFNPYTQTRYVDEPALALVEIVNESSLFMLPQFYSKMPPVYQKELQGLWKKYLKKHAQPDSQAELRRAFVENRSLVRKFLSRYQRQYFNDMKDYLRKIGLKIPLAGSNLVLDDSDLAANAELDFIDRHSYWDHPKGGYGNLVKMHNQSLLKVVQRHNLISKLSFQRVEGKPFVVSEWNLAWPNEYRSAGPMLLAAYALFQDWDGLIQFDYGNDLNPEQISGNFDVSTKPEIFYQFAAMARLFHRRDVRAADPSGKRVLPLYREELLSPKLPLLYQVARELERGDVENKTKTNEKRPYRSDTGELVWDDKKNLVKIQTSKTEAVLGQLGDAPIELKSSRFSAQSPFACLHLTSLDDQALELSKNILITAVGRSENTGTIYGGTRTYLRHSGVSPILLESLSGSVWVKAGARKNPEVFQLNARGERAEKVPVSLRDGWLEIPLGQSALYEIIFKG